MPAPATPFSLPLALAGYLTGRRRRETEDYDHQQDAQKRQDTIDERASADADRAEARRVQAQQFQQIQDRQDQQNLLKADEAGYAPVDQVHQDGRLQLAQGVAQLDAAPLSGAADIAGGGAQAVAPSVYKIGAVGLAKSHPSVAEAAREDQQQQARALAYDRGQQAAAKLAQDKETATANRDAANERAKDSNATRQILAAGAAANAGVVRQVADQARADRIQNTFVEREGGRFQNNPMVKRAQTRADILNQILSAAKLDNPIGDYVLQTEVAKLADPLHIVTDEAHHTITAQAGAPERVQQMVKNLVQGQRLSPSTRKWIMSLAANEAANGARQVDPLMKNGGDMLRRRGYEADSASVYPDPFEAIKTLPEVQEALRRGEGGQAPAGAGVPGALFQSAPGTPAAGARKPLADIFGRP